ncbi:S-adenosyl-L-methionine-dependent methyltransferase [Mycena albidolilacea]|uniref:S-adenosyl-L-methionine-dependent methyltransferase n=1 Tax=Mycena albidolilacea TaxID=1033008 RepID=A0AAD6Z7G6_9AGAR|nr:S-adenosyl-L-methionine-dependent methyltransferase [Mycena albidolilacea]
MADLAGYPGYLLTAAHESEQATRRLDEMHAAFTRYFGGELGPSPIAEVHPRKILDLGCGSGAWAIQAANQFPEAEVIAVDVSPLAHQQIPGNMRFKQLDLTKAWDLEKQSFDIVHSRLVLTHVPNGENVVKRSAQLVKPGGLLLIEDININCLVQTGGPATRLITSKVVEIWESRSADTDISRKYAGIMTSMGYFPRVHAHKILMPFDGTGSDEAANELGLAMKKSWTQLWETLGSRFVAEGITEAMIQEQREELCGKDCKATMNILNRILYIFGQLVPAEDERAEDVKYETNTASRRMRSTKQRESRVEIKERGRAQRDPVSTDFTHLESNALVLHQPFQPITSNARILLTKTARYPFHAPWGLKRARVDNAETMITAGTRRTYE